MARYLSSILAVIKQHLRDEFVSGVTEDWKTDELKVYIDSVLRTISEYKPYRVKEVHLMVEDYKEIDVSDITDLVRDIEVVEYPVGNSPRDKRNVEYIDAETIEIDMTLTPEGGSSGTLTGTVTFTSGSATVTGSGTDFDGELEAGYFIRRSTASRTRWYRVASIESDTSLTLEENVHSDDAGADTVNLTPYYSDEVCYIYCEKLHSLTETSSTLTAELERLLIMGVCAQALIALAGDKIGKVNVGSGATPTQFRDLGLVRLAEYKAELLRHAKPRGRREYSKS